MTQTHLLIIGHGSRSSAWNQAVSQFAEQVNALCGEGAPFVSSSASYMEHGQPNIPDALRKASERFERIAAQPLFLSVSRHVTEDIPKEFASAATLESNDEQRSVYRLNGSQIDLLTPPPAASLIAQNAWRRIRKNVRNGYDGLGVLFVYYGTRSFLPAWDALAQSAIDALKAELPAAPMRWAYAGDMVGFSPEPMMHAIDELAAYCDRVLVMPALVANGVIQNQVIPQAIARCAARERVLYFNDAILPDPDLARSFFDAAVEGVQSA